MSVYLYIALATSVVMVVAGLSREEWRLNPGQIILFSLLWPPMLMIVAVYAVVRILDLFGDGDGGDEGREGGWRGGAR